MSDLAHQVRALIAREAHRHIDFATDAARFHQDLGMDHIDQIGLSIEIEEAFDVQLEDEEVEGLTTVGKLIALVVERAPAADWRAA